jgi:branched-chain amino acid transport system ATP-binding protein
VQQPSLMLLDEPTEGLAPLVAATIADGLADLRDGSGMTFVIVDRNLDLLARLCSQVKVLQKGRVVHSGAFAEFAADDALRRRLLAVDVNVPEPAGAVR